MANGCANFVYCADVSSWMLTERAHAGVQIPAAAKNEHAMQLVQATGRLLNGATLHLQRHLHAVSGLCNVRPLSVVEDATGKAVVATTSRGIVRNWK